MNPNPSKFYGYRGQILIVDLEESTVQKETLDQKYIEEFLGGRGWAIKYLFDNLEKDIDPLGPENILVISLGPLTGTLAPSSARYTIASKSPLTGGIGYANSGGHFAPELAYAGYDAIFIHGRAKSPVYLYIKDDEVEIKDAKHLWGKDTWETDEILRAEYSEDFQVLSIGQGGENLVKYAAILNNLSRAAARTGVGAVMGSKNLKAIAVKGSGAVEVAEPKAFDSFIDETLQKIYDDPAYPSLSYYGTAFLVDLAYISGGLATRNNQTGIFEDYESLSAETFDEEFKVKSESCFACPIHCGKYSKVESGKYAGTKGGSPEYETIVCFGSKCGIGDLAVIIKANELANRYGLDTISLGDTIAFVMEAFQKGLLTKEDTDGIEVVWGNEEALLSLITKVAYREGFGNDLAEGTKRLSEKIGKGSEKFAHHIKGMEPPAYDVRTAKAFGLGWATATRGADHLAALPNFELLGYDPEKGLEWFGSKESVDPFSWKGKPRMVYWHENFGAIVDSAEMCKYTCFSAYAVKPEDMSKFLTYATGYDFSPDKLMLIGERIYNLERLFNLREGIGRDEDKLPPRFTDEPLPEGPAKGNYVELDKMLPEYYELRQWDFKSGLPSVLLLEKLNLLAEAEKYDLKSKEE
ncbi:MAG: aldehyde ferredoxin oxidoreductase family protein [Candidatus Heimdallarchaeota archaeon]|nr:aldehyde ferredoxin oxidoreductase family protein [Candidatus Heimdallarchaeota archaeon]